jgi:hypothetical protein
MKGSFKETMTPTRFLTAGMLAAALMCLGGLAGLGGCAAVKPYEREVLADPIMDPNTGFAKQTLLQKFLSTREGSTGGGTGLGGGCGCSK